MDAKSTLGVSIILLFMLVSFLECQVQTNSCKLTNLFTDANVAIGFPRLSDRAPSTGTLNIAVLFTDFSDAPGASGVIQQMFNNISPTTENFYSRQSYGKLKINLIPNLKWLRMSKTTSQYVPNGNRGGITVYNQKDYIQEAVNIAISQGLNFSNVDLIAVLTDPSNPNLWSYGPAFTINELSNAINASGKLIKNGFTSGKDFFSWRSGLYVSHELGHTLGLPDLYSFTDPNIFKFIGNWSMMGLIDGVGKGMFGWERWLMGWLTDSQVACISNTVSETVSLSAIETNNCQTKMAVIPLCCNKQALVLEVRQKIDDDSQIPIEGVLAYVVDSAQATGNGTINVYPSNYTDSNKLNQILTVGQSVSHTIVSSSLGKTFTTTAEVVSNIGNSYQIKIASNYLPPSRTTFCQTVLGQINFCVEAAYSAQEIKYIFPGFPNIGLNGFVMNVYPGVTKPVAYNIPKAYQSMDVTFQLTFSFPTTTTNNVCFGINFSSPLVLSVPIGCITVPNLKNILPPTSG